MPCSYDSFFIKKGGDLVRSSDEQVDEIVSLTLTWGTKNALFTLRSPSSTNMDDITPKPEKNGVAEQCLLLVKRLFVLKSIMVREGQ
jgi:hypothetical protein